MYLSFCVAFILLAEMNLNVKGLAMVTGDPKLMTSHSEYFLYGLLSLV